ncbi:MAG: NADH-quinone oxidoreductase subunit NuoI [Candidatus Thermoplasmatota archaeon]|jgi:NADH-quinone oxidoreductase subunit I|nr:NADH-quinone oxidoreductase subunit NuoI [Candidatus Thermoplasmatota archaeon]MCL5793669.1 NADH-quinone oxidoreductase subunit NuoI [Candidatus Thermoplasmatota archaeon]
MTIGIKEVEEPRRRVPLVGVISGMATVGKHLFQKPVTLKYPEEKPDLPERFRFRIYLKLDDCVGCTLCEQVCPNGSIKMQNVHRENPRNKRMIYPDVNFGTCTVCRNCEEICPTDAIYLTHVFETSRTRNNFTYSPEELAMDEDKVKK